ncbi:MAG: hypothetical protein AAB131_10240 [Actinomycetota bacterium]
MTEVAAAALFFRAPGTAEARHVFQEDVVGSHVANGSENIWPEVAIVGGASTSACNGERLARKARNHDVHRASPCSTVEGPQVVPDWGVVEKAFGDAALEDLDTCRLVLDVADGDEVVEAAGECGASDS